MQFFNLFIGMAVAGSSGLVSATPARNAAPAEARGVLDDCFNQGFATGQGAGCSAAGNGRRDLAEIVSRQLTCSGNNGDSFNAGFNEGFNKGFNNCRF